MKTAPFVWGLLAVGLGSLLGCGVTMADLQALNPGAKTLQVPCPPWQVPGNVKLLAYREEGDHLASDETPDVLLDFAPHASVFIEINKSAPIENVQVMAEKYGLICQRDLEVRSTPLESLRPTEPCSMQANAAPNPQFVGDTNSQPCNPGAGGPPNGATGSALKQAKKAQREVRVCAAPPGSPKGLTRWGSHDSKGKLLTNDEKVFADAVANADILFILDDKAPAETIYWFVKDPSELQCPGKTPMPYAKAAASGRLAMMAAAASMGDALNPSEKPGDGKTSDSSSPDGQGPPLSFFENLSRNMALAGALAQGDTSGNAKDPNGHRNGIPSGTNVGGWSFPPLQAGVSIFQIISAIGLKPKQLVDKIAEATKRGQRVIIAEVDKDALKMVDQLIKETSPFELAKGFQEVGSVMPFSMGQKVTAGLESKFQAHKIFEWQAFEHFEAILGPTKKELDIAIAKAPSVVLTDAEHQVITKKLNQFWSGVRNHKPEYTPQEVKKMLLEKYQEVYKDHPHWLQSIQHLFLQLP